MTRHATVVISRAFNLRLWFAVGSFGTIAALGVLWALWTSQFLTSNLLDRESEVTQEFLESIIAIDGTDIFADYGDGGTPGPKTLDFSNHIINIPGTIRANIYAPSYRVLWSTEAHSGARSIPSMTSCARLSAVVASPRSRILPTMRRRSMSRSRRAICSSRPTCRSAAKAARGR